MTTSPQDDDQLERELGSLAQNVSVRVKALATIFQRVTEIKVDDRYTIARDSGGARWTVRDEDERCFNKRDLSWTVDPSPELHDAVYLATHRFSSFDEALAALHAWLSCRDTVSAIVDKFSS